MTDESGAHADYITGALDAFIKAKTGEQWSEAARIWRHSADFNRLPRWAQITVEQAAEGARRRVNRLAGA